MCPPLLQAANQRIGATVGETSRRCWRMRPRLEPDDGPVDAVTFSYSLTMIPDWFQAIERAYESLKPGGMIGVVDFYIPQSGRKRVGTGIAR